jgi:ParB family chromosome partitioning protein
VSELADSIRQHGLIHPLTVRPIANGYEVIAGNRRLEAVMLLNFKTVACRVIAASDRDAYEIAITENVQCETLNPIEEASAFKRYVENFGWGGVSQLAMRIGRSQEFVNNRIRLLQLPEKIQEGIIRQRITCSAALELLPLEKKAIEELVDTLADGSVTRDRIRSFVRAASMSEAADPVGDQADNVLSRYHKEIFLIDKALNESIVAKKNALSHFDRIMNSVNDWVIQETLEHFRSSIREDIERLVRMRKTLTARMPIDYFSRCEDKQFAETEKVGIGRFSTGLWLTFAAVCPMFLM